QRAIRRILENRTTLLITHRLSQIRCADKVLLLRRGELVDEGTHDELLERCPLYQRIFAHYDEIPVEPQPAELDGHAAVAEDGDRGTDETAKAIVDGAVAPAATSGEER